VRERDLIAEKSPPGFSSTGGAGHSASLAAMPAPVRISRILELLVRQLASTVARPKLRVLQFCLVACAILQLPGCASYAIPSKTVQNSCDGFEPWETCALRGPARTTHYASAADALLAFYQGSLRRPSLPTEGCIFYPSCSVFARQAFARYNEIGGTLLTLDRLFVREHPSAITYYPRIQVGNSTRLYDPVP